MDHESKLSDAYLDAVLIGGREPSPVVIADYSDAWPSVFDEHRVRVVRAIGDVARRIEHIGSTAVPGLAAKPIIDIMVTVDEPDDESGYRERLEDAGYVLRVREPGHRMFRNIEKTVHLHVWRTRSEEETRQLAFRDHLRTNATDRRAYEELKRGLAGQWRDVNYYAEAKGPFIQGVLRGVEEAPTTERVRDN